MIAALRGKVIAVNPGSCLLDVGGVGYEVHMPLPALAVLIEAREEVTLHTHLHLREDLLQLFGFLDLEEKKVFERLIAVSGIGPKIALSMLSVLSVERIGRAIETDDHRLLASVPGIGQKTAQRLVLELKGKFAMSRNGASAQTGPANSEMADAVEALIALGYTVQAALQAVESAAAEENVRTASTLIRAALKRLSRDIAR